MSAKIIAVANMKGGVGKTTMVVSTSEAFAADGYRVLVIDLDAQASASVCFAGDSLLAKLLKDNLTIDALLENRLVGDRKIKIASCIRSNISNVTYQNDQLSISLLPASYKLRTFEFKIIHALTDSGHSWDKIVNLLFKAIEQQLESAIPNYDYVIIDCAPGISIMTEAAIRLADLVIVPTIPDFLSTYGLQSFCASIWERGMTRKAAHIPKQLPHVLVTRRRQIAAHNETLKALKNEENARSPRFRLFETIIPEAAAVADGLGTKITTQYLRKWGPNMPTILDGLTNEIREALNG